MKNLFALALVLCAVTLAFAGRPDLPVDGAGVKLQGFAPTGKKSVELTVNSQNINMSDDLAYSVYSPTACVFRLMSTQTKAGIKHTLPANATTARTVNMDTPFLNFSGCVNGQVQVQ